MTEKVPCVILDSWLLDVEYENFCKPLKPVLREILKGSIYGELNIKFILSKMEENENNLEELEELSKNLEQNLYKLLCAIVDESFLKRIKKLEGNKISTRLNAIKEHIIYSTTYKLSPELDNEINNIENYNTKEVRQYIKEFIQE